MPHKRGSSDELWVICGGVLHRLRFPAVPGGRKGKRNPEKYAMQLMNHTEEEIASELVVAAMGGRLCRCVTLLLEARRLTRRPVITSYDYQLMRRLARTQPSDGG